MVGRTWPGSATVQVPGQLTGSGGSRIRQWEALGQTGTIPRLTEVSERSLYVIYVITVCNFTLLLNFFMSKSELLNGSDCFSLCHNKMTNVHFNTMHK